MTLKPTLLMLPPQTPDDAHVGRPARRGVARAVGRRRRGRAGRGKGDRRRRRRVRHVAGRSSSHGRAGSAGCRRRRLRRPPASTPRALIAHPAVVTNFREIFNDHIGAHIMAFVLAFARGFQDYFPRQLRREWRREPLDTGVIHLPESTMLLVGVGGIGAEAARLAAAFGMRVIGVDARRHEAPAGVPSSTLPTRSTRCCRVADFVVLTVPHTPATEGFMNRARFQRMKRTAFFINIGRGMTTRLDDLVAALRAGEIAGAGLDVFEQEPLPAEHPAVDAARRPHHAAYRRLRPVSRRPALRHPARQLPALHRGQAAQERRRQAPLVLRAPSRRTAMSVPVGLNVWSRLMEDTFPYLDQTVEPIRLALVPRSRAVRREQGRRGLDAPRLRARPIPRQALRPRGPVQ